MPEGAAQLVLQNGAQGASGGTQGALLWLEVSTTVTAGGRGTCSVQKGEREALLEASSGHNPSPGGYWPGSPVNMAPGQTGPSLPLVLRGGVPELLIASLPFSTKWM